MIGTALDVSTMAKVVIRMARKTIKHPIGVFEEPDCYVPNTGVYPLCIGKDGSCKACVLYEHMVEAY